MRALLAQRGEEPPPSRPDDDVRTRRARELVAQGAFSPSFADEPFGLVPMLALGIAQELLDEDTDPDAAAREFLGRTLHACERLLERELSGTYLTTRAWAEGPFGLRMWTQASAARLGLCEPAREPVGAGVLGGDLGA